MNGEESLCVSLENCAQVKGPFYHGTKAKLEVGDRLFAGNPSNYEDRRTTNHVYLSTRLVYK